MARWKLVRRRQFLVASTGALAACAVPKVHHPDSLAGRLRALAVTDDDFYRPVLYSWTTAPGIAHLRANRRLLVATAEVGGFTSTYIHGLVANARRGDQLAAALLSHPALIRRRYAWTSPFATVMGMGRRTYGTSLIQIVLRPEAWIARFEAVASVPFSVVDAAGAPVPRAAVLAAPERIGAVFHVHPDPAFREYVIASDAMIASWSIATTEIRQRLVAEAALLRELRDRAALPPGATEQPASASWQRPGTDLHALWHATLAFDNDRYHARTAKLDAILAALDAYEPAGAPLVHAAAYSARSASHSASSAT